MGVMHETMYQVTLVCHTILKDFLKLFLYKFDDK